MIRAHCPEAEGGVEGNPAVFDPNLIPHVIGESLLGGIVDQPKDHPCGNLPSPAKGGQSGRGDLERSGIFCGDFGSQGGDGWVIALNEVIRFQEFCGRRRFGCRLRRSLVHTLATDA
jgi:hypothetical protein